MGTYDSLIIGHLTKDFNIDCEGHCVEETGGAVLYSSAAANSLGHHVAAITKIAREDLHLADSLTLNPEDVYILPSEKSTVMRNHYHTADKEQRECVCLADGDRFHFVDLPQIDTKIYHFAGLLYGDYSDQMMKKCAHLAPVALDVQSCLRHADMTDGSMFFRDWESKKEMLPFVSFLKTDAAEAEILTGTADRAEAAKILFSWGAKEILITHNSEVLAYDGRQIYTCPIRARNLSGRTGRGDTTFAVYINERLTCGVGKSLLMATAAVSLKMESMGPLDCDRAAVMRYIEEFYPEYGLDMDF